MTVGDHDDERKGVHQQASQASVLCGKSLSSEKVGVLYPSWFCGVYWEGFWARVAIV